MSKQYNDYNDDDFEPMGRNQKKNKNRKKRHQTKGILRDFKDIQNNELTDDSLDEMDDYYSDHLKKDW
jgi:predicted N-acyltransferase